MTVASPSQGTGTGAGTPPNVTSPGAGTTAGYNEDIKPILDADCVRCHNTRTREGRVDLSSYGQVVRTLQPGNANSVLIRVSRQGGSTFREWRGDGTAKADLIRRWVVEFQARESRWSAATGCVCRDEKLL